MARKRKGNNPGPIAVRRRIARRKQGSGDGKGARGEPVAARRVLEFPKPPDEVISDRILFDIGGDWFAIRWTAEIERLPAAAPVAIEPKQRLKPDGLQKKAFPSGCRE
jgi:hypothetical protein